LPNGEIFQKAIREERVVLTFDLDFGEIVAASGGTSVSAILFRLRNTRADFVVQRLKAVLDQSTEELAQGAVVLVEDGRHRVRRMPIGK
jgi:predicted nuclease of predicted toxin-antitoxin system